MLRRKKLRSSDTLCLYAIGPREGGPTKIGITGNINRRLLEIQAHSPIKLCVHLLLPSSRDVEIYLHKALAVHHLHGEWFDLGLNPREIIENTLLKYPGFYGDKEQQEDKNMLPSTSAGQIFLDSMKCLLDNHKASLWITYADDFVRVPEIAGGLDLGWLLPEGLALRCYPGSAAPVPVAYHEITWQLWRGRQEQPTWPTIRRSLCDGNCLVLAKDGKYWTRRDLGGQAYRVVLLRPGVLSWTPPGPRGPWWT